MNHFRLTRLAPATTVTCIAALLVAQAVSATAGVASAPGPSPRSATGQPGYIVQPLADAHNPALAWNGAQLMAVWRDGDELAYSRWLNAAWTAPETTYVGAAPSLAGAGGHIYMLFNSQIDGILHVEYSQYDDGADVWLPPQDLSGSLQDASSPVLAVVLDNTLSAAWATADSLFTASQTRPGGDWSVGPLLIEGLPISGAVPSLVVAADGHRQLAWQARPLGGDHTQIFYSREDASGWTPPQQLSYNTSVDAIQPRLALSGGELAVAWEARLTTSTTVTSTVYVDRTQSGIWAGAEPVGLGSAPALIADGSRGTLVAWTGSRDGIPAILVRWYRPGGFWSEPWPLAVNPGGVGEAALALGPAGQVWAAWTQASQPGSRDIAAVQVIGRKQFAPLLLR